jgi:hypothetical protein
MAEESALVFIAPEDNLDEIEQKIRAVGNNTIELLVPDGTAVLQVLGGFARLRQSLEPDKISLLVISSDEKTLNAARLNQFETISVQGARVAPPPPSYGTAHSSSNTIVLPRDEESQFFEALDQLPQDRYAGEDDADLYAALDDLSDVIQSTASSQPAAPQTMSRDDEFAASLDDWSMGLDDEYSLNTQETRRVPTEAPRRRVRPEDLELSAEEISRNTPSSRRSAASRPRPSARAERVDDRYDDRYSSRTTARSRSRARWEDDEEDAYYAPRPWWRNPTLILVLIMLALLLIFAIWFFRQRTTVGIILPGGEIVSQPYTNEIFPIGATASTDTVQARVVQANAEFQLRGEVLNETLSPASAARGTITIINRINQEFPLPAETQFVAIKEDGQEVRFRLEQPVTVPPATTSTSLTGTSTTFGQIEATVVALSGGAASNVGENTIQQIILPGQEPIFNNTGNLGFLNGPITGGEDLPQRIVTEAEVERYLREGIIGLYNAGLDALRNQIDPSEDIEQPLIWPSLNDLGKPEFYEISVDPPNGQEVDPNNPVFTITLRASFSALAAPKNLSVRAQLEKPVVVNHFLRQNICPTGSEIGVKLEHYQWDGQSLTGDGIVSCTPSETLTADLVSAVKLAIAGKPYAEAVEALDALQERGAIAGYELPERNSFPAYDFFLNVTEIRLSATATPTEAP